MFNPEPAEAVLRPGRMASTGEKTHAIKGHEFGLKIDSEEREQLLAFLRTL
jgi:hypothetical protein